MMSPELRQLAREIRDQRRELAELRQRQARAMLHGKTKEVRAQGGDWQVRLDLGDGVLSPWIPLQPAAAGGLKIKVRPTIGERMIMLSPSGTVGTGSWAIRGPFDDDHPPPEGEEDVVLELGKTRITVEDGKVVAVTGEGRLEMDGEKLTHNGRNISANHTHKDVMRGDGVSGPPSEE